MPHKKENMFRTMMHAKIHLAFVTEAKLRYIGSITIDGNLMDAVGILENEKVQIVNITNGARFETYAIKGKPGVICLNGGGARLCQIGDELVIMAYKTMTEEASLSHKPRIAFMDKKNNITLLITEETPETEYPQNGDTRFH